MKMLKGDDQQFKHEIEEEMKNSTSLFKNATSYTFEF